MSHSLSSSQSDEENRSEEEEIQPGEESSAEESVTEHSTADESGEESIEDEEESSVGSEEELSSVEDIEDERHFLYESDEEEVKSYLQKMRLNGAVILVPENPTKDDIIKAIIAYEQDRKKNLVAKHTVDEEGKSIILPGVLQEEIQELKINVLPTIKKAQKQKQPPQPVIDTYGQPETWDVKKLVESLLEKEAHLAYLQKDTNKLKQTLLNAIQDLKAKKEALGVIRDAEPKIKKLEEDPSKAKELQTKIAELKPYRVIVGNLTEANLDKLLNIKQAQLAQIKEGVFEPSLLDEIFEPSTRFDISRKQVISQSIQTLKEVLDLVRKSRKDPSKTNELQLKLEELERYYQITIEELTEANIKKIIHDKQTQLSQIVEPEKPDTSKSEKVITQKKGSELKPLTKKQEEAFVETLVKTTKPKAKKPITTAEPFTKQQQTIMDLIKAKMSQRVISVSGEPEKPYFGTGKPKVSVREEKIIKKVLDLFSPNGVGKLEVFLNDLEEGVEVEASVGDFVGKGFRPGVTLYMASLLKTYLDGLNYTKTLTSDVVKIISGNKRQITEGKKKYVQEKTRESEKIRSKFYGVQVSKSQEGPKDTTAAGNKKFDTEWATIEKDPGTESTKKQLLVTRTRSRTTYTTDNYQVDVTRVKEDILFEGGRVETYYKNEVEVERKKAMSLIEFLAAIKTVMSGLYLGVPFENLMTKEEEGVIVSLHNELLKSNKPGASRGKLVSGYWNEPKNVQYFDMLTPLFYHAVSSVKLNGRRSTVVFDRNKIALCSPPEDVFVIGSYEDVKWTGTILDAEFMDGVVYVVDILVDGGRNVRDENLEKRRELLEKRYENLKMFAGMKIERKHFHTEGKSVYSRSRKTMKEAHSLPKGKQDGIIIQSTGNYYSTIWKWKPKEELTIDFFFDAMSEKEKKEKKLKGNVFWIKIKSGKDLLPFLGSSFHPFQGWVTVPTTGEFSKPQGRVVECAWDYGKKTFTPQRYRDDKPFPNASSEYERKAGKNVPPKAADAVWRDIHNPIAEKTILGDDLKLMRKLHMKERSALLGDVVKMVKAAFGEVNLVDIGTGRGSMIHAWAKANLNKVLAIEPDKKFMEEFKKRLEETKKDTSFVIPIEAGAEEEQTRDVIKEEQINAITAFFSLTFFPKDKTRYQNLIETLALLPKGGVFAGLVMDGADAMKLVEKENGLYCSGMEAKTMEECNRDISAFAIQQLTAFTKTADGAATPVKGVKGDTTNRIKVEIFDEDTMVKSRKVGEPTSEGDTGLEDNDYTEWLFFFDAFQARLEARGFKLLNTYHVGGTSYDLLPSQARVFSDLNRGFVFERVETDEELAAKAKPAKKVVARKTPTKKAPVRKAPAKGQKPEETLEEKPKPPTKKAPVKRAPGRKPVVRKGKAVDENKAPPGWKDTFNARMEKMAENPWEKEPEEPEIETLFEKPVAKESEEPEIETLFEKPKPAAKKAPAKKPTAKK